MQDCENVWKLSKLFWEIIQGEQEGVDGWQADVGLFWELIGAFLDRSLILEYFGWAEQSFEESGDFAEYDRGGRGHLGFAQLKNVLAVTLPSIVTL